MEIIASVIAGIITIVSAMFAVGVGELVKIMILKSSRNQAKIDKYKNIVSPAFRLAQQTLDHPKKEILLEIREIFDKNSELIDVEWEYWLDESFKKGNREARVELCQCLGYEYDKLCSLFGISKRSFRYKVKRRQFKDTDKEVRRLTRLSIWLTIGMILMFIVYIIILNFTF